MPLRILRDGILTSERINSLSTNAELFYRRLMSVADDYGRFSANPTLLRASCYPLKLDSVKEDSISKHLAECVGARLIVLYTVHDKAYLELQDFGQRINGKPKYPGPSDAKPAVPGESPGKPEIPPLDEIEDEIEDGGESGRGHEPLLTAYHSILPNCQHVHVLNDKRKRRIAEAVKLAKRVCREQGWVYRAAPFWQAYFAECALDPWMRGEVPNPKNPNWRQNLDVLLAEDRFAGVMDRAITALKDGPND
jgi:hypothetical protein